MNKPFDFNKINQYDNYIINISKKDYEKMQECIYNLTKKYDYMLDFLVGLAFSLFIALISSISKISILGFLVNSLYNLSICSKSKFKI